MSTTIPPIQGKVSVTANPLGRASARVPSARVIANNDFMSFVNILASNELSITKISRPDKVDTGLIIVEANIRDLGWFNLENFLQSVSTLKPGFEIQEEKVIRAGNSIAFPVTLNVEVADEIINQLAELPLEAGF